MAGRTYTWRADTYDSVTTIISDGVPKPYLKAWGQRMVAEFAYDEFDTLSTMHHKHGADDATVEQQRGRAVDWLKNEPMRYTNDRANIGSLVHEVAEARALGSASMPDVHDPIAQKAVDAWQSWHDRYDPTMLATEFEGYHRGYLYAGTADGLIEVHESVLPDGYAPRVWHDRRTERLSATPVDRPEWWRLLLDYKTSEKGPYPEVGLQLNAYANFEFIGAPDGTEQPMPAVDGAVVVKLRPSYWSMTPVVLGTEYFKAFLYAREVKRWRDRLEKLVLLRPAEHTMTDADHALVADKWK